MIAALLAGSRQAPLGRACPEYPDLDPVLQVEGTLSDGYTPYTQRIDCGLEAAVIRARQTPPPQEQVA